MTIKKTQARHVQTGDMLAWGELARHEVIDHQIRYLRTGGAYVVIETEDQRDGTTETHRVDPEELLPVVVG